MSPFVSVNPSLNHATHSATHSSSISLIRSQIGLVLVNYNYLLRTSTLETQWQSVLVVWAAFTTCGRHSLYQAKSRLSRMRTYAANAAWIWGTFTFFFFSIAFNLHLFIIIIVNCVHRYPRRCHDSLVSLEKLFSYICVSVCKKKRYSIFYIEDVRIALGYRLSTHRKKRVF